MRKPKKLVGSIPGGSPLHGVSYLKNRPTVLAKEDDEYPPWLWTLLDAGNKGGIRGGNSGVDLKG